MRALAAIAALAVAIVWVACGGSHPSSPASTAAKKSETAAAVAAPDAGTVVLAPYVYSYNPMGKRDPFRSTVEEVRGPNLDAMVCKEPLCQWDLDQLVLVGVVTGDANPLAMVEDAQGRGYVLRRSSRIGKQGGKVTQILRDSVTITEQWTSPDGRVTPNEVTMRLRQEKTFAPIVDLSTGKQY